MEGLSYCQWRRWLWIPLLFTCVSTEVTGPVCACKSHGSCDFKMQDGFQFFRKRNVALGRPATMSSVWDSIEEHNEKSGPACLAVNGKRSTDFRPENQFPSSPNCIHTGENDRNPYWEVDLGEPYPVASITIYWRDKYLERSEKVTVTVDEKLCHTFQHSSPNPFTVTCGTPLTGQTVRLSKNDSRLTHYYYLTVCEVEVWVCLPGFFGPDCEGVCPLCKNKQICSPVDGACPHAEGTFTPLNPDGTQLAFPIAGSILGGSFFIGISIAVAIFLRGSKNRLHEPDARVQRGDEMMTEVRGDTFHHPSGHAVQTSAGERKCLPSREASEENVSMGQNRVLVPKKKGNSYKPFPKRQITDSDPENIYENEEYEEVV